MFLLGMAVVMPWGVYAQGKNFTEKVNDVEFEMIYVRGGTFRMGATEEQGTLDPWDDEYPLHTVRLLSYYIGKFEVTQGLWEAVMGSNPSSFKKGDNYPVENVSWDGIQTFLSKLSQLTGKQYTLPTEAQWEYAARFDNGINTSVYIWCSDGAIAFAEAQSASSDENKLMKYSGSDNVDEVAWYNENSRKTTHPVGTKQPNVLGIYDMSGNVWEWCSDWFGPYSSDAQTDPIGPATGTNRVLRGGSWDFIERTCRVSNRGNFNPCDHYYGMGFRLALVP